MISTSASLRASLVACLCLLIAACSSSGSTPVPDAGATLQAIPPADPSQYEHVRDMKNWRNPYVIIRANDVALLDPADNAEIILKREELLPALAHLPPSNWPYGRVVAAAANTLNPAQPEGVAIRRNKGIVGGLLADAHITVKWVPST